MSMVPFEHSWDCLRITTGEFRFPQNNDYYGNTICPQAQVASETHKVCDLKQLRFKELVKLA